MEIKSLEQRKKQRTLLIIALCIALIAFLILYFGFWKKPNAPSEALNAPQAETNAITNQTITVTVIADEKLKKVNLNVDFLVDTILAFLKPHGKLPIEKGTTGRTNPFVP